MGVGGEGFGTLEAQPIRREDEDSAMCMHVHEAQRHCAPADAAGMGCRFVLHSILWWIRWHAAIGGGEPDLGMGQAMLFAGNRCIDYHG